MSPSPFVLEKPPLLSSGDPITKREQIKTYFLQTWQLYESLFSLINQDSAYFLRPEPLRHPLIFYYGHTAVFYVNKLILGKYIDARINANIESICAVGVDEMSWDDLKPDNYQWPSVEQVRDYRNQVKQRIVELIGAMPLDLPIRQDSLAWVILMGIEHERIHVETSSVIMRMLDLHYLTPQPGWQSCASFGDAPQNSLIKVSGGKLHLGKPTSNDTYGWDNEYGKLDVQVADFSASQYLVSNGEYLQFVEQQGYQQPEYWDAEGQSWLNFTQAEMPRFWFKRDGQYWQRNLLDECSLPLNWPVEVNYLEAKAFCNWKNKQQPHIRLPTEAEWQLMRNQLATDLPQWQAAPGNINLEHYASSCPVDRFSQGEFFDLIGNAWQWTESPIDGYPGFSVHPLYDDFSTPTFDGKHNMIKGGSWISTGNLATRDSRYAFRRHFFQHAGFRYVQSASAEIPITPVSQFETQPQIAQMLHHHYQATLSDAQQRLLSLCYQHQANKALDIGCGVGRLSFELARQIEQVEGIDFTARHIQHALQLKDLGQVRYTMPSEGELVDYHEIDLRQLDLLDASQHVQFYQGDGHNLKPQFSGYDLILCHDVLDQLYDPQLFLHAMLARLNVGGVMVISCAFQWQTEYTQQSKWLTGIKQDGENVSGVDGLQQVMRDKANLLHHEWLESSYQKNAHMREVKRLLVTVWQSL
jgi:5-histidylcysteine sulfoxide synthase/putative 4-mercaptohistidine N1-methyltranferase